MTHGVELAAIPAVGVGLLVAVSFTPSEATALTVAVAALLAAIFTGAVNIITAWRTTRKVEENTAITQEVKAEVLTVKGHVNSAATKSDAQIEALLKELADTRLQIAKLEQTAAMSAQAQALSTQALSTGHTPIDPAPKSHVIQAPGAVIEAPKAEVHLENIDKNTAATVVKLTDALKESTTETVEAMEAVKDAIKEQP